MAGWAFENVQSMLDCEYEAAIGALSEVWSHVLFEVEKEEVKPQLNRARGVVWCGVVWCGVVWCGVVWCGVVWCGVVWCGVVWCGVVWCGVVWCGVVWCGVVWCGAVRCGVVWCGVVWRAAAATAARALCPATMPRLRSFKLNLQDAGSTTGPVQHRSVGDLDTSNVCPTVFVDLSPIDKQ